MNTSPVTARPAPGTAAPSQVAATLGAGWARTVVEMKNLFRNTGALGFTVLFPVMMVLLFASIFSGTVGNTGVDVSQFYVASIIGSSLMSTGFVGLAVGVSIERQSGMLKRLAGTPMPKPAYFLGKIGMIAATLALQVVVLVALGVAFFHVHVPTTIGAYVTFVWVFVLGTTASTMLGLVVGGTIRNAQSAVAVVNLPFVALQFISGVWIVVSDLPKWMVHVSQVFPLHWICRGMRSVFLPESFAQIETGHSWQMGTGALVLGAWCIIGFVLCLRTFRWTQ